MDMKNSYWRFGAMIITSMIVMFGLMYLNTDTAGNQVWGAVTVDGVSYDPTSGDFDYLWIVNFYYL